MQVATLLHVRVACWGSRLPGDPRIAGGRLGSSREGPTGVGRPKPLMLVNPGGPDSVAHGRPRGPLRRAMTRSRAPRVRDPSVGTRGPREAGPEGGKAGGLTLRVWRDWLHGGGQRARRPSSQAPLRAAGSEGGQHGRPPTCLAVRATRVLPGRPPAQQAGSWGALRGGWALVLLAGLVLALRGAAASSRPRGASRGPASSGAGSREEAALEEGVEGGWREAELRGAGLARCVSRAGGPASAKGQGAGPVRRGAGSVRPPSGAVVLQSSHGAVARRVLPSRGGH